MKHLPDQLCIATVSAALLLSSCATPSSSKRPAASGGAETTPLATRLYLAPACPGETRPNALGEILAGLILKPILESAVSGLGDALVKAGKEQVTPVQVEESTHFYSIDWSDDPLKTSAVRLNQGCVTIVHGRLAAPPPDRATNAQLQTRFNDAAEALVANFQPPAGSSEDGIIQDDAYQYLAPGQDDGSEPVLEFTEDIRFYGRFALSRSDDLTALKLEPRKILVGEHFVPPKRALSGKRDIVATLGLYGPGKTSKSEAFAVSSLAIKKAKSGTYFSGEDANSLSSGWFPLAAIPQPVLDQMKTWDTAQRDMMALKDLRSSVKAELAAIADGSVTRTADQKRALEVQLSETETEIDRLSTRYGGFSAPYSLTAPVTVQLTLTETQEANKFLVDLGQYLSNNNEDIAKPFFDELDPATQRSESATEADNEDTLRIAAITAVSNYRKSAATEGEDRNETTIRVDRIKAEQACRKLRAAGYADIDCVGF